MAPTRESLLLVAATGLELSARWQSQARRALAEGRLSGPDLSDYARLASAATRLRENHDNCWQAPAETPRQFNFSA